MSNQNFRNSRRDFLKKAGGLILASGAALPQVLLASSPLPNPVGYSAASWPANQFDDAMLDISALGFQGIQIPGWIQHEYRGKVGTLKARLDILRLKCVAVTCSGLSPDPAQAKDYSSGLKDYAAFTKALGGKYLQVTGGGQPHVHYTAAHIKAFGSRLNHLGRLAQASGLLLGFQPQFGNMGEPKGGLSRIVGATDSKYVRLIVDVAELALGGADPAEVIRTYHDRLLLLHFKDVRKKVIAEARKNSGLTPEAGDIFCEIGQGGVDFPAIVRAIREVNFSGWIIIELAMDQTRLGNPAESAKTNLEALKQMGFHV